MKMLSLLALPISHTFDQFKAPTFQYPWQRQEQTNFYSIRLFLVPLKHSLFTLELLISKTPVHLLKVLKL